MAARERLPELLRPPFRRRVRGHVVMQDPTGAQFHDHEHVQCTEGGGDHHEEVAGRDHLGMVADEGEPTLFWIGRAHWSPGAQVLSHSAGRDQNPELQLQFIGDTFLSLCRILGGHLLDQLTKVLR